MKIATFNIKGDVGAPFVAPKEAASRRWRGVVRAVRLDPTPEGSLLRCVSCRSPTNHSEAVVTNLGFISAAPKPKLVNPSSVDALGLNFGFHHGIIRSERDRMIATSTVKKTRVLMTNEGRNT